MLKVRPIIVSLHRVPALMAIAVSSRPLTGPLRVAMTIPHLPTLLIVFFRVGLNVS